MEHQIKWHFWPMSDAEYHHALADIRSDVIDPQACGAHSSRR
mgnify:CR=1 FL=1